MDMGTDTPLTSTTVTLSQYNSNYETDSIQYSKYDSASVGLWLEAEVWSFISMHLHTNIYLDQSWLPVH